MGLGSDACEQLGVPVFRVCAVLRAACLVAFLAHNVEQGLLEGTDSYEDPMDGNPVGPTRQAYHPPGDFSHVLPTGPVPEGRIVGHAGGRAEHDFAGFMQYQQQEEVESL